MLCFITRGSSNYDYASCCNLNCCLSSRKSAQMDWLMLLCTYEHFLIYPPIRYQVRIHLNKNQNPDNCYTYNDIRIRTYVRSASVYSRAAQTLCTYIWTLVHETIHLRTYGNFSSNQFTLATQIDMTFADRRDVYPCVCAKPSWGHVIRILSPLMLLAVIGLRNQS